MIDLHTHTTFSDGSLTPSQLLMYAQKNKIKYLAIADHNSCLALPAGQKLAQRLKIILIRGIELDCQFEGEELHLLGYNINPKVLNKHLQISLTERIRKRTIVLKKMTKKLEALGFSIPVINPKINLSLPIYFLVGCMIFSPKVKAFNEKVLKQRHGYLLKPNEFMKNYLFPNGLAYVQREFPRTLEEGIELIHKAGGLAVLAHPRYRVEFLHEKLSWPTISKIIKQKIDGIEIYHPGHSDEDIINLEKIVQKHGLLKTGGSDFHRPSDQKRKIGYFQDKKPISSKITIDYLRKNFQLENKNIF